MPALITSLRNESSASSIRIGLRGESQMQWDPTQYLHFAEERLRPFDELLARVDDDAISEIVDLGCGPGSATLHLFDHWPNARVHGIDSSNEMIEQANLLTNDRLHFSLGDARDLHLERPLDLLVANAMFQWIPRHIELFPHFIDALRVGGWFAFQVPAMGESMSHAGLAALAESPPWRAQTGRVAQTMAIETPERYVRLLNDLGCRTDCWVTTYLQLLSGEDAVFEWTKGSVLRPYLEALELSDVAEFTQQYREILRDAYPAEGAITIYPFRRLFVVAQRQN